MSEQPQTGKINRTPAEASLHLSLEDLMWLRSEWLERTKVMGATRTGYEQKTKYFVEWWTAYGPSADWRLTERGLDKFEEYLTECQNRYTGALLAWHTRHNALRRVSELFGWAYENKFVEGVDPRTWMPTATGEAPQRSAPNVDQLWRLMDEAGYSKYPLRDQTILALFIGTGIRLAELTDLTAEKIVLCADGSGTAAITGKRTRANKSGKRTVAFDAFTGHYLATYLDYMQISEGSLFFSDRTNTPLAKQSIYKMVKRTIKAAGLADSIQACHDLRRAFATILSMQHVGDPIWAGLVQRQLGHKHYKQTAAYTLSSASDMLGLITSPLAQK